MERKKIDLEIGKEYKINFREDSVWRKYIYVGQIKNIFKGELVSNFIAFVNIHNLPITELTDLVLLHEFIKNSDGSLSFRSFGSSGKVHQYPELKIVGVDYKKW